MANEEYIKSLEERIEKLEALINLIKIEDKQSIIFNGCNIGPVALERCKETIFEHNQMETGVFMGYKNCVADSAIHNFKSVNSKSILRKCDIKNFSED